jgi:hypothetical protein
MQLGIIAYPLEADKAKKTESIKMGLVDYKSSDEVKEPSIVLEWVRTNKADFFSPRLDIVNVDINSMRVVGSLMRSIAGSSVGKHINDPASLLQVLQKQLGRQLVFDPRTNQFELASAVKEKTTSWHTDTNVFDGFLCTVEAEDETEAKEKIIRKLSSKAAVDPEVSLNLVQWLTGGQKVERVNGADGAPPEVIPLSVYSRRASAKA